MLSMLEDCYISIQYIPYIYILYFFFAKIVLQKYRYQKSKCIRTLPAMYLNHNDLTCFFLLYGDGIKITETYIPYENLAPLIFPCEVVGTTF